MLRKKQTDKVLTVQVHHENLNPRTFKIPINWIYRASWSAWFLLAVSLVSSFYAVRMYVTGRAARPELVADLEEEIQELKIALEKKGTVSDATPAKASVTAKSTETDDPMATDQKPAPGPGEALTQKDGVWSGLAEGITLPSADQTPTVKLEDPRLDWQGKYAQFTLNVMYREPGKGSQQGHIVVLSRSTDRIFAHPEGVLNTGSGNALFSATRGEYFSVARFRVLKGRFGPFETPSQLSEIQVFLFDLNNKLILTQTYKYGK